jgi:hypothetical protein
LHGRSAQPLGELAVVVGDAVELVQAGDVALDEVNLAGVARGDVAEGDLAVDALGDQLACALVAFLGVQDLGVAGGRLAGGGAHRCSFPVRLVLPREARGGRWSARPEPEP